MVTFMGGGAVSWYSYQKEVVVFSPTEAEYINLCSCDKDTVWNRTLISGTGLVPDATVPKRLLIDNEDGMGLVRDKSVIRCTKHADVR